MQEILRSQGEENQPTECWRFSYDDPGSLEAASLTTWGTQLTAVESHAGERDKFANDLVIQVAEPLKHAAVQYDELRKSHVDFHTKLEKERDASYSDLKKVKGKYDGACQEVENKRKKMESSFDHGKQKSQAAYQQQILEMNNIKVGCCTNVRMSLTTAEYISYPYQHHK